MKLFAVVFIVLSFSFLLIAQENDAAAGRLAPNFVLENLTGDLTELSEELGDGPILLSFWATWCKPCLEELKELKKIYNDFKDEGFKLFAISIDNERTIAKVKSYVRSKDYNFPVLYDTNSEIARLYYARNVPFSVLIDKNGTIVYSHMGYTRGDEIELRNRIKEMIGG